MIDLPRLRAASWVIAGTLAGLALGAVVGEWILERQVRQDTGQLIEAYMARADKVSGEAVAALGKVNASREDFCSDADVTELRRIVITSQYLKALSRLQGRRMWCSSLLGKLERPIDLPAPDLVTDHGRFVLLDTPVNGIPGVRGLVFAQGSASVVIGRDTYSSLVDPRLAYTVVADYGDQRKIVMSSGPQVAVDGVKLQTGRAVTIAGKRYEVRCSANHTGCMLARLQNPDALMESPVFLGLAVFGALAGFGGGIGITAALARARSLGRRLRKAIGAGALTIVYQPILGLADRKPMGAEALLRWQDRQGRAISPEVFIAVAEEEGFITSVTRFVVRRVLAELGARLKLEPEFQVNINVTASDLLDHTFSGFVKQELKRARVEPRSLGFEITERSTADREAIGLGIQKLRQAGHRIYIDDFGADYSSLAYLAHLKVDAIKLDRTFTRALDDIGESIVPQIVEMSRVLGLTLVIEGIEKEEQAQYFLNLDWGALGQGWLFGRPVSAAELFD